MFRVAFCLSYNVGSTGFMEGGRDATGSRKEGVGGERRDEVEERRRREKEGGGREGRRAR